jgi:uncharacterized membrane protein YcfT
MAKQRVEWIDVARGLALTGVLVHHVLERVIHSAAHAPSAVWSADLILDAFRMPTLVAISGLLSAGVRYWPWRDVIRRRVGPLLFVYAIWAVIATFSTGLAQHGRIRPYEIEGVLLMGLRPQGAVWYLFALAVYVAAAKALARVPSATLIALAVVVALASTMWLENVQVAGDFQQWYRVGEHWAFFVCAERGRDLYLRLSQRATTPTAVVALAVFWGLGVLAVVTGVVTVPAVVLVLAVFGTVAAVMASAAWADAWVLGWARAVGRNSLGVYVVHGWLAYVLWALAEDRLPEFRFDGAVVPLLFALVLLGISYTAARALDRWAPVPFLRPWWDTTARTVPAEREALRAQAQ